MYLYRMRLAILTLAVCSFPILAQTPPKTVEETKALLTSHPWYVSGNCTVDQSDWDTFTNASSGANDGLFDQRSGREGADDRRDNSIAGQYKIIDPAHVRVFDEKTGKKPVADLTIATAAGGSLRITSKGVTTSYSPGLKECIAQLPSLLDPAKVAETPYIHALKQCMSAPLHKFGKLHQVGLNMEGNIVVARPDGFHLDTVIYQQRPDGKMHLTEVMNRFSSEAHEICDIDTGFAAHLKKDPEDLEGAPMGPYTQASSELAAQAGNKYGSEQIFDGNTATAWVEGKPGPGVDEWIEIGFLGKKTLSSVRIFPGYGKSDAAFKGNNRPKTIRLQFEDGSTQQIALEDAMKWQTFEIKPVHTASVRLIIVEVYRGTGKSDDTAISEVQFP